MITWIKKLFAKNSKSETIYTVPSVEPADKVKNVSKKEVLEKIDRGEYDAIELAYKVYGTFLFIEEVENETKHNDMFKMKIREFLNKPTVKIALYTTTFMEPRYYEEGAKDYRILDVTLYLTEDNQYEKKVNNVDYTDYV